MTLAEAKENFEKLGAIDERSLEHVAPVRDLALALPKSAHGRGGPGLGDVRGP